MQTETVTTNYGTIRMECEAAYTVPAEVWGDAYVVPEVWTGIQIAVDLGGNYFDAARTTGATKQEVLNKISQYGQRYLLRQPLQVLQTVTGAASPAEMEYIEACTKALGSR